MEWSPYGCMQLSINSENAKFVDFLNSFCLQNSQLELQILAGVGKITTRSFGIL